MTRCAGAVVDGLPGRNGRPTEAPTSATGRRSLGGSGGCQKHGGKRDWYPELQALLPVRLSPDTTRVRAL